MNPNVALRHQNVYYCELSGPCIPRRDSPGSASSFCVNVNPELRTVATQVSKSDLKRKKKAKKSLWARVKDKLLSPVIRWWKRSPAPVRVPPEETSREPTPEHRGLEGPPEEIPVSKTEQAIFSSPLSGRSYNLKASGNVEAAFWKLNESTCAPLAVSTGYTDLLEQICGGMSTFDVNAKKIKLRVLRNLVEDDAQLQTVEKRLVTKLENLERKLDDLLRFHGNRGENIDDRREASVVNDAPNFICLNLPAFTSSISDTFALQKYLRDGTFGNAAEENKN